MTEAEQFDITFVIQVLIEGIQKMKKTIILTAVISFVSLAGLFMLLRISSSKGESVNFAEVRKGTFEISVSGTGEFVAENSFDIMGPETVTNQNFRASAIRVLDIVPEGTLVKKGDYVASLDRSNFENTLKDEINNLNDIQARFEMKLIDTSVVLNTLRDAIREQVFAVEEAKVNLEQSVFEPPAMQRQAKLSLEKAQRLLEQQQRIYNLKFVQAASETRNLRVTLENQRKKVNDFRQILASFTVTSPVDGMIIYKKDRTGNKIKAGSVINPFNPVVASIPDLSTLNSRIFISETDVNKVKPGLEVEVSVDAFKDKKVSGFVASVAKIGEQLSNSDSRVFEVMIRLKNYDPTLVPSMTTGNKIIVKSHKDVIYVPAESVYTGPDNIPYVYTKNRTRQVVIPGESNDKNIIIEKGLAEGTMIYLSLPEDYGKFTLAGIDELNETRQTEVNQLSENRVSISGKKEKSGMTFMMMLKIITGYLI